MRWSSLIPLAFVCLAGCKASGTTGEEPREPTDLALLQGVWVAESYESDGRPVTPGVLRSTHVEIVGDTLELFESPNQRPGEKIVTFKLDPSQSPKHIDMLIAFGPEHGMIPLGIYRIDEDYLRICWADPGKPRPTAFTTINGSARACLTLTKVRDGE